jgi:hypothetical protein
MHRILISVMKERSVAVGGRLYRFLAAVAGGPGRMAVWNEFLAACCQKHPTPALANKTLRPFPFLKGKARPGCAAYGARHN